MRALFLLVLLAGLGAGFIYPWAVSNFSGREIGSWQVYDHGRFQPVDVALRSGDAPVRVLVDVTTDANYSFTPGRAVLTVTASNGGRAVLESLLRFNDEAKVRDKSPQIAEKISRDDAGLIATITDGTYHFLIGRGDAGNMRIKAASLILRAEAGEVDPRFRTIGISLTASGFSGLVLTLVGGRSGRPRNPNSQPPPPRWGRGNGNGQST
jgi:hypothetical protein